MDKKELIDGLIKPFLEQVGNGGLETKMFPKVYDEGIRIKVGLGQGKTANVPYIALVGEGQEVQNGFYPVVAYFKNHGLLVLAYGESLNGCEGGWGVAMEGECTIANYFKDQGMVFESSAESAYGRERMYNLWYVKKGGVLYENEMEELYDGVEDMLGMYRTILDGGMDSLRGMNCNVEVWEEVFNYKKTSYNYYWALSLLDYVKAGRRYCSMHELAIGMLGRAWNEAIANDRLGELDHLGDCVYNISKLLKIGDNMKKREICEKMYDSLDNDEFRAILNQLEANAPYFFLKPWIAYNSHEDIAKRSRDFEGGCPYGIWANEVIKINYCWMDYFKEHVDEMIDIAERRLEDYLNDEDE